MSAAMPPQAWVIASHGLPGEAQARHLQQDLPAAEWAWIQRLRRPTDRLRSLVGRALARRLLARCLDCPPADIALAAGPGGKPRTVPPPAGAKGWHFNIAHSGDVVLVAIALAPVGVDVEHCPDAVDAALLRLVTGAAPGESGASPRDPAFRVSPQAFCCDWVCREAALKACGRGLAIEPARLRIAEPAEDWRRVDGPPEVAGLSVRLLWRSAAHCAALCLPTPLAEADAWALRELDLDAWLAHPRHLEFPYTSAG